MADTPSALPGVMQARMAALEAQAQPPNTPIQTTAPTTPAAATPTPAAADPATQATVTLSRDEYNTLQANAGKTAAAVARAETERLRAEETAHRLTEFENASKATLTPAIPAPALPIDTVEFSADEEKDFGDSKEYISKVVKQQLGPVLATVNSLIAELKQQIVAVDTKAGAATTAVAATAQRTFLQQVKTAVPNLDAIKVHKNWTDYLDETDDMTGATLEQLLAHNVQKERLDGVVKIYKRFAEKYMQADTTTSAGYNGGNPSGAATVTPNTPATEGRLKQSDRKKASEDYRKGKITYDELQVISKAFDQADKDGLLDFDK